jgi:signal transduction histidine kinase
VDAFLNNKSERKGLGLAVCNRIVEAHDGRTSVESVVGKGTTFTVTLSRKLEMRYDGQVWVNSQES